MRWPATITLPPRWRLLRLRLRRAACLAAAWLRYASQANNARERTLE
jgi:hypothetical protein